MQKGIRPDVMVYFGELQGLPRKAARSRGVPDSPGPAFFPRASAFVRFDLLLPKQPASDSTERQCGPKAPERSAGRGACGDLGPRSAVFGNCMSDSAGLRPA